MPTISLRLTDDQRAELEEWAHQGQRSIQKEIIWRLFSAEAVGAPKYGPATGERRTEAQIAADNERYFKPDPKPGKK